MVITDKEIADGTVVEDGFGGETVKPSKPSTSTKPNPEMGAGVMNSGAAIATVLAAMAA